MAKRTALAQLDTPYTPPQRCFGPCRHCGQTVQGRAWADGEWRDVRPRRSPLLGIEHVCAAQTLAEGALHE